MSLAARVRTSIDRALERPERERATAGEPGWRAGPHGSPQAAEVVANEDVE